VLSTGLIQLFGDPSADNLIAVTFFRSQVTRVSDGSPVFVREINVLVRLVHLCLVQIAGYFLAMSGFSAQIGTEFAAGSALPTLDDTGKAIIVVFVVKFIHLRGVIHRYLKPVNILIDQWRHPKIGDLGGS
jgi:serine/threonine protein kinase